VTIGILNVESISEHTKKVTVGLSAAIPLKPKIPYKKVSFFSACLQDWSNIMLARLIKTII
jgi:hypothetical protein